MSIFYLSAPSAMPSRSKEQASQNGSVVYLAWQPAAGQSRFWIGAALPTHHFRKLLSPSSEHQQISQLKPASCCPFSQHPHPVPSLVDLSFLLPPFIFTARKCLWDRFPPALPPSETGSCPHCHGNGRFSATVLWHMGVWQLVCRGGAGASGRGMYL